MLEKPRHNVLFFKYTPITRWGQYFIVPSHQEAMSQHNHDSNVMEFTL